MEILVEHNYSCNKILEENKQRKYIIEGICIQTNVKNKNGRVYPLQTVLPEINRYIEEDIKNSRAVGELNHPISDPHINYERVSHKFESLKQDGDNFIGRAVITCNTPMGSIVAGLMDEGIKMGISTRALGTTKVMKGGVKEVQKDFHLISAGDIVSNPSAPDAYLTNLMENKEWVWANGILIEREKEIKEAVNKNAKDEKVLIELFKDILSKI